MRAHATRYPFELAMADAVQRCIEAGAAQVDVAVEFAGAQSWVRIAADVAPAALVPAAAAAKRTPRPTLPATPAGLDLVSACVTVATRVAVAADDVDPAHRTVIRLDGLHEVLAYKRQEGRVIEAMVVRLGTRLADALGLAFHRALSGHRRRGPVVLTVNAEPVAPRDPFGLDGPVVRMRRRELPLVVGDRVTAVAATPYVLPCADIDPGAGRQGFFVYQRDRLVQAGGWSRLNIADRVGGIARVAVDLPATAATVFGWEAAPRRVLFPAALVPAMRAVAFEAVSARADLGSPLVVAGPLA